jgi:hypothetical protein
MKSTVVHKNIIGASMYKYANTIGQEKINEVFTL